MIDKSVNSKTTSGRPLLEKKSSDLQWIQILVIVTTLSILTVSAWQFSKKRIEEKVELQFDRESQQVVALILERMRKYEDALQGGVATIHALGGDVSQSDWKEYSKNLKIDVKYPGINGIGIIHNVQSQDLGTYLATQRKLRPNYKVHPDHNEEEYFPISYIEPVESNVQAVGLDMAHERNRYEAAKKARDTGEAIITGPITLVQDSAKTPGFLFYSPFYRSNPEGNLEGRKDQFVGLVYAPFVVKRLMEGVLARESRHVGISITDDKTLIFNEHLSTVADFDPDPLFSKKESISLYGRVWDLDIRSSNTFRANLASNEPLTILLGGILIDLLLISLFLMITRSRNRAIAYADEVTHELQIKAKDLETISKYKSQFLANMSHELRTPMNGVLGYAELLGASLEESGNKEDLEDLKEIQACGNHLFSIIKDILDITKIESGKLNLDMGSFNLTEIIDESVALVKPSLLKSKNKLDVKIEAELKSVYTDRLKLKQIIINILGNAIKFTENGNVFLRVSKTSQLNKEVLKITVQDTGIGIPKDKLEEIFEAFVQGDTSSTRQYDGSGLGLHLTKSVCEVMGGKIEVSSELGKGSIFSVYLPSKPIDQTRWA